MLFITFILPWVDICYIEFGCSWVHGARVCVFVLWFGGLCWYVACLCCCCFEFGGLCDCGGLTCDDASLVALNWRVA